MYKITLSRIGHRPQMTAMINAVLVVCGLIDLSVGHGRLWEPPSRSSMWRRGYNTTVNINDNELSCGGFTNQWISYGGLCGVCGDPYQQHPRDNEIGGKYASGIITRTYPIGGTIHIIIGLTANHLGYFEFKLCPVYDPANDVTQACMDRHPLKILNGDDNGYRFYIREPKLEGNIKLTLVLPRGFLCKHCVLQWRYRTGTRWGCEPDMCGKGKGPQEEFYGCSDISVADVSTTLYNDPVKQIGHDKGMEGLNDLGAPHRAHTVIWSIEASRRPNYFTPKPKQYAKIEPKLVTETKTANPSSAIHNKHMATLRVFLEELTLRALLRYYGSKGNHQNAHCSPTKRYQRNPIVHEFCERICVYDLNVCPDVLCFCTHDQNILKDKAFTKAPNYLKNNVKNHSLNRNHLKKFVRKLIAKNKLVENIPTPELQTHSTSHEVFRKSHAKDIRIPKLGRMDVIDPAFSLFRATKNALQEENFIPTKYISRSTTKSIGAGINKFVTKSSLKFGSTFDPDKYVHLGSGAYDTSAVKPKIIICTASVQYSHNPFMAKWCNTNCPFGFCPPSQCSCD